MYPDRFSLPFVTAALIAAAERQRPALGTFNAQTREQLEGVFRSELSEVRARFFEIFDDQGYWSKLEQAVMGVAFPRYCVEAEKQGALEARDYGLWRGGDLLARGTYLVLGFIMGFIMVKWDRIPIPETWNFFMILTALAAPFIPDVQVWNYNRKYRRALNRITRAMAEEEVQRELYRPLLEPSASNDAVEPAPLQQPETPVRGTRDG